MSGVDSLASGVAAIANVGLVGRRNAATMVMDWLNLVKIAGFYGQRWLEPKIENGQQVYDKDGNPEFHVSDKHKKVGLGLSATGSLLQEIFGKSEAASARLDGWTAEQKKIHADKMADASDLNKGPLGVVDAAAEGGKVGFLGGMFATVQRIFTLNYRVPFQDTHRLMGEALCLALAIGAVAALYKGRKALNMRLEPLEESWEAKGAIRNALAQEVKSGTMDAKKARELLGDNHKLLKYDLDRRAKLPAGHADYINPEESAKLLKLMKQKSGINWVGMATEMTTALTQRLTSAGEIRRYMTKDYRQVKLWGPLESILKLVLPSPLQAAVKGAVEGVSNATNTLPGGSNAGDMLTTGGATPVMA